MATVLGQQTSYDATEPNKRVVTDRIIMTDPNKLLLINALGLRNEGKFEFVNGPGTKYEWLHDTRSPRADVLADDAAMTSVSTTTEIDVANGEYFQPGDVILIDDEYMWVSAVAADVVTVTRDFGGTQATHASDAAISIVSRARLEGANASDSNFTEPTTAYNFSQIFQKTLEVSRTDSRIQKYGISNVVEREITKAMDELAMLLANTPYHGQRKAGSKTTPRAMGGFDTFIAASNKTALSNSPALRPKDIEDAIQDCWDGDGNPDLLVCGPWAKRKIADFYAPYVRTERSETLGGITIERIMSPLGIELAVAVDRNIPADTIYLLDREFVGYITMDDFFYEELGKVGDTADGGYGQVVGEYGFVVAKPAAHAKVSGFSTSL